MPKHSHRRVFAAWAILALCLCAFAWPAAASPWSPTLNFETKFGTDRTIVSTHLLIPFAGDDQSLLFGDFRSVSTRNYSWETNLGLAYRWLRPDGESAFGTYAFYDRRHILPTDSVWQQVTLGAEYLTANTTTRLNLYMPQQHRYLVTSTVADSFLIRGNNLIYQEADLNVYETAMRGFDVGVTHRIQSLLPFNVDFSVTGFHFTAPDAPNLTGANFRLETIFEDILNISGSQLTIGIEAQNDSLRGTESFVGMGIRIPFGAGGDSSSDSELTGVSSRLMDPVVRDIDIVTTRTNPLHEVAHEGDALLSDTGTAIEGIWFIEEGASNQGAGTPDDPISVEGLLSSARFGPNQIIVAQGQNDINVGDQSLTLLPGQILMSGESAIDLVSERGRRLTFQLDGTPTTLTTDVDLPIVTVSGNNIIRDIRFRGGSYAIFGDDVFGDVTISNVDIADSTRTGIYLAGESRESINISVSDSRIENTRTGILTDFFGVGDVQINILRNRIAAFDHGVDAHASDLTSGSFTLNENEIHVSPDANSDWVSGATVLLFAEETSTIEAVGNVIQIASEEEEPLNNGNGAWLYTVGAESEIFFIENTIVTDESVYRGVSLDAFSADEGGMAAAWLINSVIESATDGV